MMKDFIFVIVFVATLFVAGNQTAMAQEDKRLNSSPREFQTFFAKFRGAVERGDKAAVATLTVFPFSYGFDAGDEGKMTRAQFIKRFKDIFGDDPKKFLTEKNPLFSRGDRGSYIVSTEDAASLVFVKKGGAYRFSAFMVEP
jgi:hypothetical protein